MLPRLVTRKKKKTSTARGYPDNVEDQDTGKSDREYIEAYVAIWRRKPQSLTVKYDVNLISNKLYTTSTLSNANTKSCFRCGSGDHQLIMTNAELKVLNVGNAKRLDTTQNTTDQVVRRKRSAR